MSVDIVGIDVGTYAAKTLQLQIKKGRKANLIGLGMSQMPVSVMANWDEQPQVAKTAISTAMKSLLATLKLKGKYIATSLSGESIVIKRLSIKGASPQSVKSMVESEAEQYIPYKVSEVNIDTHVLGPDPATPGNIQLLLVAARKDVVNFYMDAIKLAKLRAAVIDVDTMALCNAYDYVYPDHADDVVLVDIGATRIHITILNKGVPVYVHEESNIGSQRLTEELEDHFDVPPAVAEAIKLGAEPAPNPGEAAETVDRVSANWIAAVHRALDTVRGEVADYEPKFLRLAGGGSLLNGLPRQFQEAFHMPCDLFNPLMSVAYNAKKYDQEYLRYVGPQMAVAFGLALRKAENI